MTDQIEYFKGKKVAVTGATGLIGSYAVKLLKESGVEFVRAVVHDRADNEFTMMADTVEACDLSDPFDAVEAVAGCDVVIGCAGITGGVNLPSIDPVSYVGPATAMVINTLQACVDEKVERFGFLSSTTVYPPSDYAMSEEDANSPVALYPLYRGIGMSKMFLEKLCRYYHETTGLGVGVVRPAGAYGRFDNFDEKTSHVLPGMVARALGPGDEFVAWGDGEDVRDFVHAEDVARGLLMAVAHCPTATPFNVASGDAITTRALAEMVLAACESKKTLRFDASKPSALRVRRVNIDKAREVLGWKPEMTLRKGIEDTVAWLKKQEGMA